MHTGRTIFSQVMDYFPLRRFKTCVDRYNGDKAIKTLTCLDQFHYLALREKGSAPLLACNVPSLRENQGYFCHTTSNTARKAVLIFY